MTPLPTATTPTSPTAPDMVQLRAWLEQMVKALRFIELIAAVLTLITRLRDLNTHLVFQLATHRRARPKSETLERVERQLSLAFPAAATPATSAGDSKDAEAKDGEKKPRRRPNHHGRPPLPGHLRRVDVFNLVPQPMRTCPVPGCGRQMKTVGYSICEGLELQPAQLYITRRKDERCPCPFHDTIVSAPTPPEIVDRGKLGPVLIVESTANKFLDHQPIERQSRHWARSGIDVAPQTLGRAVGAEIDLLE